jgi:hypothetical protein
MGNTATNIITFDEIRTFAKAAFGECAVTKPADGVFTVVAQLEIGSTSGSTTYVAASSSAIDFGAQVRVYGSSTFTAGVVSATGSPFAGATLSFSGAEADTPGQGEFFSLFSASSSAGLSNPDTPDGRLELYDTIVLHKTAGSTSNAVSAVFEGQVDAKRTSFENWNSVEFRNATNTLNDLVFTNMGKGFFPAVSQGASSTFDTIKARVITSGGLYASTTPNDAATSTSAFTITALAISEIVDLKDIRLFNYDATTTLINSTFDT